MRSYNPTKDLTNCPTRDGPGCQPNTWHWDDISINPAIPLGIRRANEDQATTGSSLMTFSQPAPANALLRFIARSSGDPARRLQVSYDNGGSWRDAVDQCAEGPLPACRIGGEWFQSFQMPIDQGVTSVRFRAVDGSASWLVRDAGWLAVAGGGMGLPTSTIQPASPTATSQSTPTPVPTAIPTELPTALPTATTTPTPMAPTATIEPTPTTSPTVTPTPAPTDHCYEIVRVTAGGIVIYEVEVAC